VFYEYLSAYIRRRCDEGIFRCLDPLLAAQAFIGMIVYHRILHEIFKVPLHCTPEEAVDAYVEVFLSGLRVRPRGGGRRNLRRIGTNHSRPRRRRS
jgi:hypothetical protein